jgi:hypothetical protein
VTGVIERDRHAEKKEPSDAYVNDRAAFDGLSPYLQMMQDGWNMETWSAAY